MSEIIDDKSEHCIPFILERIQLHRKRYEANGENPPPFFVGLNGVQGAGKTTLVGDPCINIRFPIPENPMILKATRAVCHQEPVFAIFDHEIAPSD